ncbi:MAG: hypothetical protein KAU14_03335 [Thermoplasmata archaeon]|nr:hypothetical protein [Thermoplasmata archaeon]
MSFESGALNAMGVDICGTISGRNVDKFEKCGLTPVPGPETGAPIIEECPGPKKPGNSKITSHAWNNGGD